MIERPLPPLRVIELGGPTGQYAGKLLADLGCAVIKAEPPEGDPGRGEPPFAAGALEGEVSLPCVYFSAGKKSVVLDIGTAEGRGALQTLLESADLVLDSLTVDESERLADVWEDVRRANPGLVYTSVTPFGRTGPYSRFRGTDLIAFAMGGIMNLSGQPGREPLCAPYQQAYQLGSLYAAYGSLLALWQRQRTGSGQQVEVSLMEAVCTEPVLNQITRFDLTGSICYRTGSQAGAAPGRIYRCKDGYIHLEALNPHNWRAFWDWLGRPEILAGEMWEDRFVRLANIDLIDPLVEAMAGGRTREELYREGQARHLPQGSILTPSEYLASPQTKARQSFIELEDPNLGRLPHARPPYRFSGCGCGPQYGAPALGLHTEEVLAEVEGRGWRGEGAGERRKTGDGRRAGVPPALPGGATGDPGLRSSDSLPLEGVRVVAFTTQVAGPVLAKLLADYGADVITVEPPHRPRWPTSVEELDARTRMERTLVFQENHRSQRSLALDLRTAEDREAARQLIGITDVVIENFSLGVMERWGFDYASLCAARPDLIMVSMQGMGRTGPEREYVSVGPTLMGLTGMSYLWSYADQEEPAGTRVAYPDLLAAAHGAVAVVAALLHRSATGRGQQIDLSQLEVTAAVMGPAYLEWAANDANPGPLGNGSRRWAPHGCYPCLGHDRWCVLAVTSDAEWRSLCEATGHREWAEDERFASNEARLAHGKILDGLISEWTRQHTPHQVMYLVQSAGAPAGPVMNGEDLFQDPHLRARGFVQELYHEGVGVVAHAGPPIRLNGSFPAIRWTCPPLGQDNELVLGELLGVSRERLVAPLS